jgi:hypothetical protein
MDALGDDRPISARLRSHRREGPQRSNSDRRREEPQRHSSNSNSDTSADPSDEAEWLGSEDESSEPDLRRVTGFVTTGVASGDVDGFAGIFPPELDVSELKGIPDRISICGRASGRAKTRGLFDPDHFKQFGIANPERMHGAGFALQRNKHGLTSHHIGELCCALLAKCRHSSYWFAHRSRDLTNPARSHLSLGEHMDLAGEGLVVITEEHVDSGLDEVHALLTKGGFPNQQTYTLVRQPFEEVTVWAAHDPVQLWKIVKAAHHAGLLIAYFDIGHKAPLHTVKVLLRSRFC